MNKPLLMRVAMGLALCAPAATSFADSSAAGPASTSAAPKAKVQNANDPNKPVCKTVETMGTRLGDHKVCRTRAEWDELSTKSGDMVNDLTRHSTQANGH